MFANSLTFIKLVLFGQSLFELDFHGITLLSYKAIVSFIVLIKPAITQVVYAAYLDELCISVVELSVHCVAGDWVSN